MTRWHSVNTAKNAEVVVKIHDTMSGKSLVVPPAADASTDNYFDESPADVIRGSTTLDDLIKRVKKDLPALYLADESGGALLTCGHQHIPKTEWDTTMLWELIDEEKAGTVPRVKLDDGREAVIVTIGNEDAGRVKEKPSTIHRILMKGNKTPSVGDFGASQS
ncbi:hypothetical protein ACHAXT_003501 [Thalassiosira profunda]